jgi:EpsI family protein
VLAALGVDDHINRGYVSATGRRANLYVGYYRAQRQGTSVHSPLNCLPGAGWEPEQVERIPFAGGAARLVRIRKGDRRLMVLYWYQTATRIEGNEYLGRLYTVIDTLRYGRNDAALVRVTVSIGSSRDAEARAIHTATEFATVVQPQVGRLLFAGPSPQTLAEAR